MTSIFQNGKHIMPDKNYGGCTTFGAGAGALTGLALGIWAAVEYLEPAFETVPGVSRLGAQWITAAISIFGGLEAAMGAGAIGGAIAGAVLDCGCFCLSCCVDNDNNHSSTSTTSVNSRRYELTNNQTNSSVSGYSVFNAKTPKNSTFIVEKTGQNQQNAICIKV